MTQPWRAAAIVLAATFVHIAHIAPTARAQSISMPATHWGASLSPTLEPTFDVGLSLIQFTEFDKEVTGEGEFVRYNDHAETVGYNILSISRTTSFDRPAIVPTFAATEPTNSAVHVTSSILLGRIGDDVSQWYQNDVVHHFADLDPVPRERAPVSALVQFELQANVSSHSIIRDGAGVTRVFRTPVFAGGGLSVGTIAQEAYVHVGATDFYVFNQPHDGLNMRLFATARAGTVIRGMTVQENASGYGVIQTGVTTGIVLWAFPVDLSALFTRHSGLFLRTQRSDARTAYGREGNRRDALHENFVSFRVRLGAFVFETYNDSPGGKDRGPTYGAQVFFRSRPGERFYRAIDVLVELIS